MPGHKKRRWYSINFSSLMFLVVLAEGGSISHHGGAIVKPSTAHHAPRKGLAFLLGNARNNPGRIRSVGISDLVCHRLRREKPSRPPPDSRRRRNHYHFRVSAYHDYGDARNGTGGGEAGGWSLRPRKRRPLSFLAKAVNTAVLETCVQNQGRPLAIAITDFVERTVEAFVCGYSVDALLLELQLLDSTSRVPGETLTGVEKRYRTKWIGALHAVMQYLNLVEKREPKSAEEFHINSQVTVVLNGRQTHDELTFVKFDKALATGGVSGGTATESIVIAPQMVPISQLVLLAIRAIQKLEESAAR